MTKDKKLTEKAKQAIWKFLTAKKLEMQKHHLNYNSSLYTCWYEVAEQLHHIRKEYGFKISYEQLGNHFDLSKATISYWLQLVGFNNKTFRPDEKIKDNFINGRINFMQKETAKVTNVTGKKRAIDKIVAEKSKSIINQLTGVKLDSDNRTAHGKGLHIVADLIMTLSQDYPEIEKMIVDRFKLRVNKQKATKDVTLHNKRAAIATAKSKIAKRVEKPKIKKK